MKNSKETNAAQLVVYGVVILLAVGGIFSSRAEAQVWPDIFDPAQLLTMNLELDSLDWVTIQNDLTFDIEVPAWFWINGEDSILVAVRRKSCDALGESPDFLKVSLKIDINEYVPGQSWHGLQKLSLENGDDQNVVIEGFAWHLHHVANCAEGYNYTHSPAYASWVKLYINGYSTGVYVHVEQRDDEFLKNRGLYISGATWLYKNMGANETKLVVGDPHSPTYETLCYPPFRYDSLQTPSHDTLAVKLPQYINMQAMLTMGAVNTFLQNNDHLWNHEQNSYFADFFVGNKRMYFTWDLDSPLNKGNTEIYPTGGTYSDTLLAVPEFRNQYTHIMYDLLDGPFTQANLFVFLNMAEALLTEAFEADPNNQLGEEETMVDLINALKMWVMDRRAEAYSLLDELTDAAIPDVEGVFSLYNPTPNPCYSSTRIDWAMPNEARVRLQIFDVAGRLVATIVDNRSTAGRHGVVWNGRDRYGHKVKSGVYFARIEAGPWSSVRKIVFLR